MSKPSFRPVELVPDWLVESPITFDDLRCTSAPSTIFRMSLPPSPVDRKGRRRSSIVSISSSESEDEEDTISIRSKPPQLPDISVVVADVPVSVRDPDDARSFLWDKNELESDSDSDSDDSTLNEHDALDPSPIDPFFAQPSAEPKPSPSHSPAPTRASSFDCSSPWFMHFDAAALAALDDQLLQSPLDAFSDLCYSQAVALEGRDAAGTSASANAVPGSYTWRRDSRLHPLEEEEDEELRSELDMDAESDSSDTDSDGLASPEQPAAHQSWGVRPRVYSPTPASHHPHWHRHARHFQQDSDGSIQYRPQDVSPPLPFHPRLSKALPSTPTTAMDDRDADELRAVATASPPPLYLPSPAVSQAQLAFLFSTAAPPRPGESVHFAPQVNSGGYGSGSAEYGNNANANGKGRRALRISTMETAASASAGSASASGSGTWFRRIRAGFAQTQGV